MDTEQPAVFTFKNNPTLFTVKADGMPAPATAVDEVEGFGEAADRQNEEENVDHRNQNTRNSSSDMIRLVCAHSSIVGESPSGKAAAFGAAIRRFESFLPSHVPVALRGSGTWQAISSQE